MKTFSAIPLALAAAACGGTDLPGTGSCTFTMSGAVTASGACTLALGHSASKNEAVFGLSVSAPPAGVSSSAIAVEIASGNPTTGTFTQANTIASGVSVVTTANQVWAESKNEGGSTSDQGSFSLTISATGSGINGSNGDTVYLGGHGSLDATLPAITATSASGTVTLHADF